MCILIIMIYIHKVLKVLVEQVIQHEGSFYFVCVQERARGEYWIWSNLTPKY